MEKWIVGRKEILKALDKSSWETVRRWKRLYQFPIHTQPNGKPGILRTELDAFLMCRDAKH